HQERPRTPQAAAPAPAPPVPRQATRSPLRPQQGTLRNPASSSPPDAPAQQVYTGSTRKGVIFATDGPLAMRRGVTGPPSLSHLRSSSATPARNRDPALPPQLLRTRMIPNDIKITAELVAAHGLKPDEYERILKLIGREPTFTELGIFSAMWNEHCSYKSSKKWLKTLPTKGARVIQGPGENAGVVDIGDGDAVVFKMESHNHPSYIEPYQGAATGV